MKNSGNTAEKDRHYICEIGRLFWGDDKQCYSADAVYNKVKSLIEAQPEDSADTKERCLRCDWCFEHHYSYCHSCGKNLRC